MRSILIVDDVVDSSLPLTLLLRHAGYEAQFVESGAQALNLLELSTPDLLLLDVMMPGMNGLEVLERIRNTPRTADLPVVMFTAADDASTRADAKARGANGYWVKGAFDFTGLRGCIEGVIAAREGAAAQPPTTPAENQAAPTVPCNGIPAKACPTVLLADDESPVLEILSLHLKRSNVEVQVANNGNDALRMAKALLPSVIVLDEQMPGLLGSEICRILAEDSVTAGIPVILLTGYRGDLSVGGNIIQIISKPFGVREVVRSILNVGVHRQAA